MTLPANWITVSLSNLKKCPWNYKEDDPALARKLEENIKRNGQIENIIVRELDTGFFEVVNGNHRLDVMQAIGAEQVVCYTLGNISDAQAKRIAIETNETKFPNDIIKLNSILEEISTEFAIEDLITSMPYSVEELNVYVKDNIILPNEINRISDLDENDEFKIIDEKKLNTQYKCPKCNYEWSGKPK